MKVLLITREYPPYVKGGMSRIVVQMAKRSRQHGIKLTIIANHPQLKKSLDYVNGIPVYRVPWLGSTFLTQIPSFGYFASRLVEDLQMDHDLVYSNYSPLFCKIKRPFIVGFRATRYGEYIACKESRKPLYALLNKLYIPFDKLLVKKADGIMSLSDNMVDEIQMMGGQNKRIEIIPNGVDANIFKPFKPRDFTTSDKKILYVGRLDARKGIDILFWAFKQVTNDIKVKLMIVGEGRERNNLVRLARTLSIPVQFYGSIPNDTMPAIYNQTDLFVLPSFYEGMPSVVMEALACGTPAIVSDASPDVGIPRFERGSVASLVKVLSTTISSEEKLQALSQKSLEISRRHSWEKIVNQTVTFLRQFV